LSAEGASIAPTSPRTVVKGGSFLCALNYCLRHRPATRSPEPSFHPSDISASGASYARHQVSTKPIKFTLHYDWYITAGGTTLR
jgi:hypothetical protein